MNIKQRLTSEIGLALIRTFIARGIAAFGGIFLGVVLGRLYGPEGVGVFALAQSVLLGAGILARYGLNNTLMRYVGRDYESPYVGTYLKWACRKAGVLSLVAAFAVFYMHKGIAWAFNTPELSSVLVGVAVAIPAFTLSFVLSGFMKGIRKPATANLLENGAVSLVAACGILLWHWLSNGSQIAVAGWGLAIAAWLVFGQGVCQAWRWLSAHLHFRDRRQQSEYEIVHSTEFSRTSRAFLVMSLAQFMQQVVCVLIAGAMLSNADLGLFKSAERMALLISFILMVINAVFPPRFASLYHRGDIQGLSRLARQGALLGVLMAAPLLLVCLVFPAWVLGWFGQGFNEASTLLRIIAIAQLVNVATGSVGFLLNMTGYEKLMRNIALLCNVVGIMLFVLFILLWGAVGAAVGLASILVVQNIVMLFFVWRKLGICTLPLPKVIKYCLSPEV